jgi:hypothetical protein
MEIDKYYFIDSIITEKLPDKQKYIHLRTRFEKLYNEVMGFICKFIKNNASRRILRKSQVTNEFLDDIRYYLVKGQVKKYNEGFEKSLFKLLQIIEPEEGWKILSTEESII